MNDNNVWKSLVDIFLPEGLALRPYQYGGSKFLFERSRALIASEPGTGKTIMLIVAANIVASTRCDAGTRILILCPKSMRLKWLEEIEKWSQKKWPMTWEVHNWERLLNSKHEATLFQSYDIVIGDESHECIKSPDYEKKQPKRRDGTRPPPKETRCGVFMLKVVPLATRVWIATATPASVSGLDYFTTLRLLLPSIFESWSAWDFKKEFCEEKEDRWAQSGKKYEGFRNTKILKEIFQKVAIKHRKAEVLPDLPPKVYTNIEVEIDPKIAALHLDLDRQMVADLILEGKPLPGHLAHVLQATALAKIDALVEMLNGYPLTENVVVFAWHKIVIYEIEKRYLKELKPGEAPPAVLTGDVNDENLRKQMVDKFQRKEIQKFLANMKSGGVGITLTAAHTAIYIELPHSPIPFLQSEDRVHRIGSEADKIHIIRVVARNTIDAEMFEKLDRRIKTIREVGV